MPRGPFHYQGMRVGRLLGALLLTGIVAACGGKPPAGPSDLPPPGVTPPGGRPPGSSVPVPPPPGSPVFVGAGDIAVCGSAGTQGTANLLDTISGTVFTLGDNAYFSGTREDFQNCYHPTWGRHRARTRPSPGNHDYGVPGAVAYFEYFGSNAGPPGRGYYSFRVGEWLAVSLNSNVPSGAGSTQAAWLRQTLSINNTRCTVAYWHHPLFSSGPHGANTSVRELWEILYEYEADLILSGHEHLYERMAPQDPGGAADPVRGIRQFIAGTGGAPLYQFHGAHPNSEVQISTFGVLKLTLGPESYAWEFIPLSGPADTGIGNCH